MRFALSALLLSSLLFTGCLGSGEKPAVCDPAAYNPCATVAPAAEIQAVQDYLTAQGITGAVQHCSGMFYKIDAPGTGATPTVCSNIAVTYEGKLTNGTTFDQATTPVAFGLGGVIKGWMNGLPLIKSGGRIYLYIPPTLGYGANATGPIPANSILVFRVDLVAVQ